MTCDATTTVPAERYRPSPWEPREYLQGGFLLTTEETLNWVTRLTGRAFPYGTYFTASDAINEIVKPYGVYFAMVREDILTDWMVVTQHGICPGGTVGMDPSKIPQFKEGKRERQARELLQKEGLDSLRFATVLSGPYIAGQTLRRGRSR
ncbi:hypothetical protein JAAARDRAFT_192992 [Jaapia argillacea MUCL 33604]|uniref:Uncharacterized protein n=1 Tax=Jaapia argillacea MUCL 33604 TaxID=933084 RepID=A0A067PUM6_9AGAM|nr:hypothetical protein JAAARDRAFT_192992 [Jaapia argillacea MUCL 33604]